MTPPIGASTRHALLLAAGLVAAGDATLHAADEPWDKLPNGILGQVAIFEGIGGVPFGTCTTIRLPGTLQ